jgi:integrase
MTDHPFTPDSLAHRWLCSESHIRKLLSAGLLKGFKIGKLWRIAAQEVQRFEACSTSSSDGIVASTSQSGMTKQDIDSAALSARRIGSSQIRALALKAQVTTQPPTGTLTVASIFSRYIEDRADEGKSVERIVNAFKRLGPVFGHYRPADVTKKDCNSYIDARRKQGISDGTIWTELTTLRTALAFAVKMGWPPKAPYIKVPQKPMPREHHLTRSEVDRLIACAETPHVKLFIRLALATAGRMSALLELTWVRVDLEARRIYLRNPEIAITAKGRATVPINDSLLEALQEAQRVAVSPYVIEWGGQQSHVRQKGCRGSCEARASQMLCACAPAHSSRLDGRGRHPYARDRAVPRTSR